MKAVDLFCGAGGAAEGLCQAGFTEIVGYDIVPQPRYPFTFVQGDALEADLSDADFVWASPPCQKHTALKFMPDAKQHECFIERTRAKLEASGKLWTLENVVGAPLHNPVILCGSMFGLGAAGHQLRRHRQFETNFWVDQPACAHVSPVIGLYGCHIRQRGASHGGRGTRDFIGMDKPALARECMGADWMTMAELSQAIPPAYSKWIGEQALAQMGCS